MPLFYYNRGDFVVIFTTFLVLGWLSVRFFGGGFGGDKIMQCINIFCNGLIV